MCQGAIRTQLRFLTQDLVLQSYVTGRVSMLDSVWQLPVGINNEQDKMDIIEPEDGLEGVNIN